MRPLDELRDRVRALTDDPGTKEIAARIATDLVALGTRAGAGEDVAGDLAHVRAQTLNLSVSLQTQIGEQVLIWLRDLSYRVVAGALAGV